MKSILTLLALVFVCVALLGCASGGGSSSSSSAPRISGYIDSSVGYHSK